MIKSGLKEFIENLLAEEISHSIGSTNYQRSEGRKGYRNVKNEWLAS